MAATVRLSCVATYCLRLRSPYNVDIEAFPNTPASKGISTDTKVVRWLPTDRRSVSRQHWYNVMSCVAWGQSRLRSSLLDLELPWRDPRTLWLGTLPTEYQALPEDSAVASFV